MNHRHSTFCDPRNASGHVLNSTMVAAVFGAVLISGRVSAADVVTIAGTGTPGLEVGERLAKETPVGEPYGIAKGPDGALYICEIATHVVVFALLMAGAAMVDGVPRIDNLLMATGGLLLGAGLGAALGMVLCGLSVFSNSVERLIGPMMRPLFWVSALFFSTNEIPSDARNVLLYNPVLHVVELTRSGWFPGYDVPQVSLLYPALWIFILFYFGLTLERVARRRLELS